MYTQHCSCLPHTKCSEVTDWRPCHSLHLLSIFQASHRTCVSSSFTLLPEPEPGSAVISNKLTTILYHSTARMTSPNAILAMCNCRLWTATWRWTPSAAAAAVFYHLHPCTCPDAEAWADLASTTAHDFRCILLWPSLASLPYISCNNYGTGFTRPTAALGIHELRVWTDLFSTGVVPRAGSSSRWALTGAECNQ